jgi:hypothetical protein
MCYTLQDSRCLRLSERHNAQAPTASPMLPTDARIDRLPWLGPLFVSSEVDTRINEEHIRASPLFIASNERSPERTIAAG